ncbi:MAG: phosphoribosylanthranilate isomerase [Phycisphaeraceae bacterium]
MHRTRIKICGIREAEDARCAIEAGADYIGLVFAEGSPRQVTIAQARNLVAEICAASRDVEPVALFANQSRELIDEVLGNADFRFIQLHGHEDRAFVESLDQVKVFKAVPFEADQINTWRNPPDHVAALLIDAPTHPGELTGGTGRVFDWEALARLDRTGLPPIILAGGLTPDNVADAIRLIRPFAVDVSSGVESSRGVKSPDLIRDFCDAVHSVDSELNRNP